MFPGVLKQKSLICGLPFERWLTLQSRPLVVRCCYWSTSWAYFQYQMILPTSCSLYICILWLVLDFFSILFFKLMILKPNPTHHHDQFVSCTDTYCNVLQQIPVTFCVFNACSLCFLSCEVIVNRIVTMKPDFGETCTRNWCFVTLMLMLIKWSPVKWCSEQSWKH